MFNKQEYCKVYKEDKIRSVLKNNELFSSVLYGPAMITPLAITRVRIKESVCPTNFIFALGDKNVSIQILIWNM